MENPRYWRLQPQRYRLVGEVCPECDVKIFPLRDICPYCGGETLVNQAEGGQVYSSTPAELPAENLSNIEATSPTK